ncbi:hypothetical protein JTB14_020443 [Gonioctena quinquepunctata]|nr:hypothetical protein JTB14_020443 [Gonioctena quinquepunctata]
MVSFRRDFYRTIYFSLKVIRVVLEVVYFSARRTWHVTAKEVQVSVEAFIFHFCWWTYIVFGPVNQQKYVEMFDAPE